MYDIAIIGAGVIGAAIARQLSKYELSIIVLDKENDASAGTSKANSGIVHAGYDPKENTLMAKLNAVGNAMFDALCEELSVPFKRNGSLVVAFDSEQLKQVAKLKQRGEKNGIPGLSLLSGEELLEKEPALNPDAKGALFAETAGITDPMLLTISLMENAVMNGAEYLFNFEIRSIEKADNSYRIISDNKSIAAKYVINAAGVFSDEIHNMIAKPNHKINIRRGQYFLLDKSETGIVNSTIFPCPTKKGKGVLVAPTAHSNIILGPASDDTSDKEDVGTTDDVLWSAVADARQLIPGISAWNSIRNFSGLRAEADTGDFVIGEALDAPNFIDVGGIKSPGLTAAPAIAQYIADLLCTKGVLLSKKSSFDPIVKRPLFIELPDNEQTVMIKKNPLYGRVICRCENITEGDIVDAIKRKPGAVTVDGVKRRCRAGMGRCQSGFCGPKVHQILARELNLPLEDVMLEKNSSYILTGRTK